MTYRPPRVAVLAATALTLIVVGGSGGLLAAGVGSARAAARALFVPVEVAGAVAFQPMQGVFHGFDRAGDVARAEADRSREQERARSEAARAEALEAENRRLTELLGLEGPSGGEGVAARVVSTGAGRSGGPLVLDRGSGDGIRPGMPVVAAGGLVGRVLEVAARHSTVLPVADRASAVGVRVGSSGAAGVAQGRGGPSLQLDLLDPAAVVEDGALAVTSGLRLTRFPAGLPVGRVTGSKAHRAVAAFAPPDRLELVKVLRWEPAP